jgi:hypothetical protein
MWFFLQTAEGESILDLEVKNNGRHTLRECWADLCWRHMIMQPATFLQSYGFVGQEVEFPLTYTPGKKEIILARLHKLTEIERKKKDGEDDSASSPR